MYPLNLLDKPNAFKSKRGRKTLAVNEGYVDVTGKTHVMTVKRLNPPSSTKNITTTQEIDNYCKRCDQNNEYIDVLNGRIEKLESLVTELNYTTKNNNTHLKPKVLQNSYISSMETEDLIDLSNQISVVLLERFEISNQLQLQDVSMVAPINSSIPPVNPFAIYDNADITASSFNTDITSFTQC